MYVESDNAEVYRKYADDLVRFATGLVGPDDAADVVSEAVVRCFTSPNWRGVKERRAYLYRSVYNQAAEYHRRIRRRRLREERSAPNEVIESQDLRPEVLAAVLQLSVRQRAVVVLTYWDDLTPDSIADLLGISGGSVRRHLARAKSHLKEVLRADD